MEEGIIGMGSLILITCSEGLILSTRSEGITAEDGAADGGVGI